LFAIRQTLPRFRISPIVIPSVNVGTARSRQSEVIPSVDDMFEHLDALLRQELSVVGIQRRAIRDASKERAQFFDHRFDSVQRGDRLDSDDVIVPFHLGHLSPFSFRAPVLSSLLTVWSPTAQSILDCLFLDGIKSRSNAVEMPRL
jgi:hypothetical protein